MLSIPFRFFLFSVSCLIVSCIVCNHVNFVWCLCNVYVFMLSIPFRFFLFSVSCLIISCIVGNHVNFVWCLCNVYDFINEINVLLSFSLFIFFFWNLYKRTTSSLLEPCSHFQKMSLFPAKKKRNRKKNVDGAEPWVRREHRRRHHRYGAPSVLLGWWWWRHRRRHRTPCS